MDMRQLLILIGIFCALNASAQDWVEVRIDDKISVQLPPNNWRQDSMGAENWVGEGPVCGFFVSKKPLGREVMNQTVIRTDEHLKGMYEDIVKGAKDASQNSDFEYLAHEIIEWKGLLVLTYQTRVQFPGVVVRQEMWHMYLAGNFYIFGCNVTESMVTDSQYKKDRDHFYSGLSHSENVTRDDQMVLSGLGNNIAKAIGKAFGEYFPHMLGGLVIAVVIILSRRKKKRAAQSKAPTPNT